MNAVMQELARDLRAEGDEFKAFLSTLNAQEWREPSPFKRWTPDDILIHLTLGDWLNVLSMSEPDRFEDVMARRIASRAAGLKTTGEELLDSPLGRGTELLAQWHEGQSRLCDRFAVADAKARMKWAGPDMSLRSAATARLMETWAHAQDVYDMKKVQRVVHARIKHIAVLGINTFAWTFNNRGEEPPGPAPEIELTGPSGETWSWNAPDPDNRISGTALEFCQVVTQGRNIQDVSLRVTGDVARRWMEIAQCFAGPPEDPPVPGTRTW